jgi:vacuolar-type H+-ATPase subunit I/STV1
VVWSAVDREFKHLLDDLADEEFSRHDILSRSRAAARRLSQAIDESSAKVSPAQVEKWRGALHVLTARLTRDDDPHELLSQLNVLGRQVAGEGWTDVREAATEGLP